MSVSVFEDFKLINNKYLSKKLDDGREIRITGNSDMGCDKLFTVEEWINGKLFNSVNTGFYQEDMSREVKRIIDKK